MRPLKEIRHDNLLLLIEEAKSTSELASRTGISVSYLLQIKNKNAIQNGKPKGIGDKIAAKLEDGMNKPRGWLDRVHTNTTAIATVTPSNLKEAEENIVLSVLDVQASAGIGAKNGDVMEIVREIKFNPEQFFRLFRGINPDNIELISVKGDSMEPTFSHGDLLFVDVTIQEYDGDGVYVFSCDDYIFVKRIQKTGARFTILSDNEHYQAWQVEQEIYIHGKVKVHQSQRLNFIG